MKIFSVWTLISSIINKSTKTVEFMESPTFSSFFDAVFALFLHCGRQQWVWVWAYDQKKKGNSFLCFVPIFMTLWKKVWYKNTCLWNLWPIVMLLCVNELWQEIKTRLKILIFLLRSLPRKIASQQICSHLQLVPLLCSLQVLSIQHPADGLQFGQS